MLLGGGIKLGLAVSTAEGDFALVSDINRAGDGFFAQWALSGMGGEDVAEVGLRAGVELGFALIAAKSHGLREGALVRSGDRLARNGAIFIGTLGCGGKAGEETDDDEDAEDVFHGGRYEGFRVTMNERKHLTSGFTQTFNHGIYRTQINAPAPCPWTSHRNRR